MQQLTLKAENLYLKPEYFRHHKNKCLLQNEKKDLSFAIFKHPFFGLKQHTRTRNYSCGPVIDIKN